MNGRQAVFWAVLAITSVGFALACGGEAPTPTRPVPEPTVLVTPIPTLVPTPEVSTPTEVPSATESVPGTDKGLDFGLSVPDEAKLPDLSGLGGDGKSELTDNFTSALPAGLNVSEGWQQVSLVTPERAAVIQELSWVSDGVTGFEVGMVDWLVWTAIDYGEVFDRVILMGWLRDGVTKQEIQVLKHLFYLAVSDVNFALWLCGQPFLETVEYADAPAVESLARVYYTSPEQAALIKGLLLTTGGVTNDWAPVVAMTWPVARFAPDILERLYDPAEVEVYTKRINLGQAEDTLLAVVRIESGAGRTLELMESIVRQVEGTIGRPLPLDYVGVLFADAVAPGAIGINYGTGMVIEPRLDIADFGEETEKLHTVLAHEVAHYWWNRNENWIDEGMAEFMAAAFYGYPDGQDYPFLRAPCVQGKSLSELPPEPRESILCDYSLGQRMFFSLYRVLGEEEFYESARRLYDQSRADMAHRSLEGTPSGVAEVRDAFGPPGSAAIDRWYDGIGGYELDDF